MDLEDLTKKVNAENEKFSLAKKEIGKVIVGQENLIHKLLLSLLADGHILLEGLPGLAKTLSITTLADVIQCEHKRIQFTPDLLPADLIGTSIYNPKEGTFSVNKGPIFTNILLADEINRAPAKVQSALLEVMQERKVTISGETFNTGNPFLVLATQNPIEQEGTYVLPEAQTDRFIMKVRLDYPTIHEEEEILNRMGTLEKKPKSNPVLNPQDILAARHLVSSIYVDNKIIQYILDIVFATRFPKKYGVDIEGLLLFGASPRASLALKILSQANAFISGRAFVIPQDVKEVVYDVLRHRLRRSYEAEAEGLSSEMIIESILKKIPVP
jgi:MoxR-like ATPase